MRAIGKALMFVLPGYGLAVLVGYGMYAWLPQ